MVNAILPIQVLVLNILSWKYQSRLHQQAKLDMSQPVNT